jgi:hypothetical protein
MSLTPPSQTRLRRSGEAAAAVAGPPVHQARSADSPPEELGERSAKERRDGGFSGTWLLGVFGFSALAVVCAVWLLGAVDQWWLLGPAMVIHLGVTALVLWLCMKLVSDGAPADDAP